METSQSQSAGRTAALSQVVQEQGVGGSSTYHGQEEDGTEVSDAAVVNASQPGQQNSSGSSIMVIPQQTLGPGIGIVPASVGAGHVAQGVVVGSLPGSISSSDHNQVTGLYTTTAGIPAEYVIPGTNMISTGGGPFVHVPVMPQQEIHSDDGVSMQDTDEDGRLEKDELREQDRFLPIANVARIMKKAIPGSGKIAKDAKECVQECVSEFVSFITSEASERCQQEKRKTINGEDILFAMSTLGFDNYVDPLKLYLSKYRESVKGEKGSLNSSSDRGDGELEEGEQATIQYQVAATLHPTMVATDAATSTIYTYPATLHQQAIHFQ